MASEGRILIAGGGIGGLTVALALDRAGRQVQVFEAAREIRPLGVGINLLPHAVRVLDALGLVERLRPTAVETAELAYYNRHGQLIWSEPRGVAAGYDQPQFSVHRGVLHMALLDAVRERLGPDAVVTGHVLESFSAAQDGVTATFRRRSDNGRVTETADALVAADGIHSAARAALHPGEGPPTYSGRMLWRATTKTVGFLSGRTMIMAGHQDQKFVCYPITPPDAGGMQMLNWVAELPEADSTPPRQDWSREVDPSRFRESFADWRFGWLDVPSLIDGAAVVYEYPLADRDPLERWGTGAVTLTGDAAHPMYPIGSNGASQAILDADCLAESLRRYSDPAEAFSAYEADRRPATSRIVLANRENGPEQVMQLAEERAPGGFRQIEDVISRAELEDIASRYKRIAGFSPPGA